MFREKCRGDRIRSKDLMVGKGTDIDQWKE